MEKVLILKKSYSFCSIKLHKILRDVDRYELSVYTDGNNVEYYDISVNGDSCSIRRMVNMIVIQYGFFMLHHCGMHIIDSESSLFNPIFRSSGNGYVLSDKYFKVENNLFDIRTLNTSSKLFLEKRFFIKLKDDVDSERIVNIFDHSYNLFLHPLSGGFMYG